MSSDRPHPVPVSHTTAVLLIASTAVVWGFGFPMTRFALETGISVGALMSLRFLLAGVVFAIILRAKSIRIVRRGVLDGLWLGIILAVIFWSQTDGMRFTTTAKSGFITGLYVLFTPLIAVVVGQGIKLTTAIGTVIATFGLYLLVHLPGGWWSGWNRGDVETLLCAFLCAIHLILMGKFARRTDAWLLASSQVIVAGIISVLVTAFLPAPFGYQNVSQMLSKVNVIVPTIYLALGSTVFAFWGQSRAQTQLGPAEAAVLFCIEPVTAALLSVFWLKEPMSTQQAFGGVLIVVAMIVSEALPYMFREITVPDTRP
ncbi:MAG TPA: DMT family transporter [Verrucomicrobiae bacterium]|jgi:drug/metabolite transporter (DMT)-like permease|nr:DMT family transporter [Verrucomicrobiae bacterium]